MAIPDGWQLDEVLLFRQIQWLTSKWLSGVLHTPPNAIEAARDHGISDVRAKKYFRRWAVNGWYEYYVNPFAGKLTQTGRALKLDGGKS